MLNLWAIFGCLDMPKSWCWVGEVLFQSIFWLTHLNLDTGVQAGYLHRYQILEIHGNPLANHVPWKRTAPKVGEVPSAPEVEEVEESQPQSGGWVQLECQKGWPWVFWPGLLGAFGFYVQKCPKPEYFNSKQIEVECCFSLLDISHLSSKNP